MRFVFRVIAACTILVAACSSSLAADAKPHRVTIQVDQPLQNAFFLGHIV
jgi:hypothetical protein